MQGPPKAIVPDYHPWALAIANVGTWRSSIAEQRVFCDPVMADMYGLTEAEANHGFSISRIREVIHPGDRVIFDRRIDHYREFGGPFVFEYRIRPRPGELRWILVRGQYDKPSNSLGMVGHGIVVDITASKTGGQGEAGQFYAATTPAGSPSSALQRAADAAVALRREAQRLDADVPSLQLLADLALHAIGRELANRSIPEDLN